MNNEQADVPAAQRGDEPAPATMSVVGGVRYLHLGTPWVQGAMSLARPQGIELECMQRMMGWLLLRAPEAPAGHAVQLGLGAASLTKFCYRQLGWRCTAVELNPSVIDMCRAWFRLPADDARLRVLQADAADFVADPRHHGTADALCVDLYDHEAAAPVLDDEAFYRGCHALLAEDGVMSVNLFDRHRILKRSAGRIAAIFGAANVALLPPDQGRNVVVLAWKGGALPQPDVLASRAAAVEARYGLPARTWLGLLQKLPDGLPDPG